MPLLVTEAPPVEVTFPPEFAELEVTVDTLVNVMTGRIAEVLKLNELP